MMCHGSPFVKIFPGIQLFYLFSGVAVQFVLDPSQHIWSLWDIMGYEPAWSSLSNTNWNMISTFWGKTTMIPPTKTICLPTGISANNIAEMFISNKRVCQAREVDDVWCLVLTQSSFSPWKKQPMDPWPIVPYVNVNPLWIWWVGGV